jgi:hypothetical protein
MCPASKQANLSLLPRGRLNSIKAGMTRPLCNPFGGPLRSIGVRAGLLHPGGGRMSGNCAAVMENGGVRNGNNGSAQAQGGESGKEQDFHRIRHLGSRQSKFAGVRNQ